MDGERRTWMMLAAASGLMGVAAGAFAAHGLAAPAAKELMRTGSTYELTHAVACLACVALPVRTRVPTALFLGGTILFSGSLYAIALGAPQWLGAVTPTGGLLFLVGWTALILAAARATRSHER
jgi:uncharacterized membrane protein YgdD (TMEM256/DUF423 family)